MEASAILKMVEDAYYNCFFIIDVIVSNNDSTMRAVLKNPSIGVQGQILKKSKEKFDVQIPEPSFLADPSYRIKVVAKHIFYIVNDSKAQRCSPTQKRLGIGSATLQKRKEKKQKNMSAQRTSREAQKVWKLQLY